MFWKDLEILELVNKKNNVHLGLIDKSKIGVRPRILVFVMHVQTSPSSPAKSSRSVLTAFSKGREGVFAI